MQVRVRLYTYLGVESDLEWFTLSDTPLMGTLTQNTENGEACAAAAAASSSAQQLELHTLQV